MVATIQPGDYVLIDKLTPRWNDYQRGDIVVFQPPDGFEQGGVPFIKRVIGLPGETVRLENRFVFVTPGGVETRVEEGYLVTGVDGRPADASARCPRHRRVGRRRRALLPDGRQPARSQDSRFFGPIDQSSCRGPCVRALLPAGSDCLFEPPPYPGLDDVARDGWSAWVGQPAGGSSAMIGVHRSVVVDQRTSGEPEGQLGLGRLGESEAW